MYLIYLGYFRLACRARWRVFEQYKKGFSDNIKKAGHALTASKLVMNDYVLERLEPDVVRHLEKHLSDCLDILANHAASGKVWRVDLQRVDARLLTCRLLIESLGEGYSTAED